MDNILLIGEVREVKGIKTVVKVYKEKNTSRLNYKGKLIKNIAVGSYIKIIKGYTEIIGVIEGEYMKEVKTRPPVKNKSKEKKEYSHDFNKHTDLYERLIEIKILGYMTEEKFVKGLLETPMISNYVYVLEEDEVRKIFSFNKESNNKINIGTITGYDEYTFDIDIQKIFASHIGIFGNTGSGKSNTLTKLYTELFNMNLGEDFKKSKFILIDFNNEYLRDKVLKRNKKVYELSTEGEKGKDKFPIGKDAIKDINFWSVILNATEKTQTPFLGRVLRSYKEYDEKNMIENIIKEMDGNPAKYNNNKNDIINIFVLIYDIDPQECEDVFYGIEYHTKQNVLYNDNDNDNDYYNSLSKLQEKAIDKVIGGKNPKSDKNPIEKFEITLLYQYIYESLKGYINKDHIAPLISRSKNRIQEISKAFEFSENENKECLQVIGISECSTEMKKIIPMIICKKFYDEHKKTTRGENSLHLIIDEAHNILSGTSNRESEEWKEYRLETFEEIIKEGRKFGCFMTISSQRPSDISQTIISQLHNFFIHRLVNEEDLYTIRKTVSFLDKVNQEKIPILTQGQCICSGVAFDFPINIQVDELVDDEKPASEDIDIIKIFNITKK